VVFARRIIAAVLFAGVAFPALAQNSYVSRLYEQVLENMEYAQSGYTLDTFGIVRINSGETATIELDVPAKTAVQIMGDCDEDCYDLDLVVRNASGKLLGEDRLDDYYPIVSIVSDGSGRIALEFDLADCAASYCYAAYSVFIDRAD